MIDLGCAIDGNIEICHCVRFAVCIIFNLLTFLEMSDKAPF